MQESISSTQLPAATASRADNLQAPVLLRAQGLKQRFGGQVVLDGVDLELRQGEVVLLRGENGSGKTTLLNILTGNLEPDAGVIHYLADDSPRTYRFPRRWWQELNPFDHFTPEFVAREGVCRTWQDIRLFNSQTLLDNIAVAEPGHPGENPIRALISPGRSERREAELNRVALTMLARLGLEGRESSSADKISLGQSKRVAIARSIAAGARILFLDEPLAGLDRRGIEEVLGLLKHLVQDKLVTLVIVEHIFNQPHLHGLVTTDWLLNDGEIKSALVDGNNTFRLPAQNISGDDLPRPRPTWITQLAADAIEVVDEELPRGAILTRIRTQPIQSSDGSHFMTIRDLVVKRGARVVIGQGDTDSDGSFSMHLDKGEIAVLQAPNGWGKTTLFDAICGLTEIQAGEIYLKGRPIHNIAIWDRVKQGLQPLPSDNLSFPSLKANDVFKIARTTVSDRRSGLTYEKAISKLSGGQKQRLRLAALASSLTDGVRIFDEPFSMLDQTGIADTMNVLYPGPESATLITVPASYF